MIAKGEIDVVVVGKRAIDIEKLKALEVMCREGNVELIWLRIDLQHLTVKAPAEMKQVS